MAIVHVLLLSEKQIGNSRNELSRNENPEPGHISGIGESNIINVFRM